MKSNPASTSGGENSGNSSSVSSDQSGDTLPVYSSEEEYDTPSVVTHPKQQLHGKELQRDCENACDELQLTPDHEDGATNGESTEEEGESM